MSAKKFLLVFSFSCLFLSVFANNVHAIFDPLAQKNNFFGIHLLFPEEVDDAKKLVNSSGGDWGYVTMPIQMGDRDLEKWQLFMDKAKQNHIIPLMRLMTEPDWQNSAVWRKPTDLDIVDMANFLNSLDWPIENRYIILFNEINRFDEWGGQPPNPEEYADLVDYAIDAFKARNPNFFMIMGGFDNASPNDGVGYLDNFAYIRRIASYKQDVFKKIDGFSSHSYPNPNFARPPSENGEMSTSTYLHEYELINSLAQKKVPVFITETGWNSEVLTDDQIAKYYKQSFEQIWMQNSDKIAAVTPFLLRSHGGFDKFSFFKNGVPTKYYEAVQSI